jgi:hypothetical protein
MVTYFNIAPKFNTQIVYLIYKYDCIAIKRLPGPGGQYYAKAKEGKEYKIYCTTDLVIETLYYAEEITELEYLNY